jgi:hypothetical protein
MASSLYRRSVPERRSIMWLFSRLRKPTSNRAPRSRPQLEALEDRWLPSTLTVTSLADSGPGTLRAAIQTADASQSGNFTIDFAVTGKIDLQSVLPDLANNISIKGPGASNLTVERAPGASSNFFIFNIDSGQTVGLSGQPFQRRRLSMSGIPSYSDWTDLCERSP